MAHELPPILKGTEQQQLAQMRDYLVRLSQSLDAVSSSTKTVIDRGSAAAQKTGGGTPSGTVTTEQLKEQANLLKSLIIKTADQIVQDANNTYVISDQLGGYYEQAFESQVVTTVQGTIEDYNFYEIVSGIVGLDAIQSFMTLVDGEIKRGVIEDPTTHQDVIGIAISQHMQFYSDTDPDHPPEIGPDGQTYYRIQDDQTFGFYTSTGWQFWLNGQKVGWFDSQAADGALHIASAVVEQHIQMGDNWLIDVTDAGDGIGFRYIGA